MQPEFSNTLFLEISLLITCLNVTVMSDVLYGFPATHFHVCVYYELEKVCRPALVCRPYFEEHRVRGLMRSNCNNPWIGLWEQRVLYLYLVHGIWIYVVKL